MKQLTLILLVLTLGFITVKAGEDEEAIKKTITNTYVEALYNLKNTDSINPGIHPDSELLQMNKGVLTKYPVETWSEALNRRAGESSKDSEDKIQVRFPMIDVTGDAAIAKVQLYHQDTLLYSDYLSLYRFKDGWKIVSKISNEH